MTVRKVFWIVLGITILVWGGALGYLFLSPPASQPLPPPSQKQKATPQEKCWSYDEVARKIASERKPSEFAIQIGTLLYISTTDKTISFVAPSWEGPLQYPYIEEPAVWVLDQEIKDSQEFVTLYPQILKGEIAPTKISFTEFLSQQKSAGEPEKLSLMRPRPALLVLKHLGKDFKEGMSSTSGVILIIVGK